MRKIVACFAGLVAVADAFVCLSGPLLQLHSSRVSTGATVTMQRAADKPCVRNAMSAVLASVVLAAPGGAVQPVFAQETAPVVEKAETKETGGLQNWRYSEFMSAVEQDIVEKVRQTEGNKQTLKLSPLFSLNLTHFSFSLQSAFSNTFTRTVTHTDKSTHTNKAQTRTKTKTQTQTRTHTHID